MGFLDFFTTKKSDEPHDAGAVAGAPTADNAQFTTKGAIPPVATNTGPGGPSASDQAFDDHTPLRRVQAACAAKNLPALIAIEKELREKMLTDPVHPPQDAREGLAVTRQWTMDQIAEIIDRYAPQMSAASAGAASGTPGTDKLEEIETKLDAETTPYLNVLDGGDPQYRYLHFKQDVQDKVFQAVRIHSMRRGVNQIGHRAAAEKESREHGNLPGKDSWCGVFAYTQAEQGGGFDPHWKVYMQGEAGIRSALAYGGMQNVWIWAFDDWMKLHDYHAMRGSLRMYHRIEDNPPIQPGDLCLIDNSFGTDPDHITTVVAYDGRFLTTVGGNQGSDRADDESGVSKSAKPWDLSKNPAPNDVRDTGEDGKPIRKQKAGTTKNVRVHGIGRWSLVDYETHLYKTSESKPAAPKPDDLKPVG